MARETGAGDGDGIGKVLILMGEESRDDVAFDDVMAMWERWRRGDAGMSGDDAGVGLSSNSLMVS